MPKRQRDISEDLEFEDADAPRISQWEDEEDLDEQNEASSSGRTTIQSIRQDMSNLPLGSLHRAQRNQSPSSESESEHSGSASEPGTMPRKKDWSLRPRPDIPKRSSKHAPTEITSKRPVSRARVVVDPTVKHSRDPRFLALTGEFSATKHEKNYAFLTGAHGSELQTLRENLRAAKRRSSSIPKSSRADHEANISRLELAVKRAESIVNRDQRAELERQTLTRLSKEEKEKRHAGKGGWWMNTSEKKEALSKARYEQLAEQGGQRAVKKAIAKKQRKISQKEKRSRPIPQPELPAAKRRKT